MKQTYLAFVLILSAFATISTPLVVQAQGGSSVCYYYDRNIGSTVPIPGNPTPNASGSCPSGPNGEPGVSVNTTTGTQGTVVRNNLSYTPLEPLPGQNTQNANFCELINLVFKILIYLGGMLAVLFLVLGGITYMVSEVVDKKSAARNRIKAAVWGLLLLLCAYLILYTINPTLVTACNILNGTNTGIHYAPPAAVSNAQIIQRAEENCRAINGSVIRVPLSSLPNQVLSNNYSCADIPGGRNRIGCDVIATDSSGTVSFCLR